MGKVIVITGLAQGMGLEVTRMLAKSGYSIAGFDMDKDGIEALKKELDGLGVAHCLETIDITDRPGIVKFRDAVLEKLGRVDVVLSNVGIGFFGPFEEVDLEKALKCLEINVIGTAAIFQAFIPHMRERRKGRLIAMSSLVGQIPFPFESIYSGSKFAVEGMVNSMKFEVAPFGIEVALVQPSQVSTSFAAKSHVLPPADSPYRKRVERFIKKDEELIKSAPDPVQAARAIVKVVKAGKPALNNQLEFKSTVFMHLNKLLPATMRDAILLNHMDIKE
jgi:short-subunit dehydrogenase